MTDPQVRWTGSINTASTFLDAQERSDGDNI
jgi:hypothetical protein